MGVLIEHTKPLSRWIRRELDYPGLLRRGDHNRAVSNLQEWLCLNGQRVVVDGDFGSATQAAVRAFQRQSRLTVDGAVGRATWQALVAPLRAVLAPLAAGRRSFADLTLAYARRHLAQHPLEIGGQNSGPWVRLYTEGHEGDEWPWCAAFVTFVMKQAAQTLGAPMPIAGSVSCDSLAAQAREAGRLVRDVDLHSGKVKRTTVPAGSLFLVRRTDSDWNHAGLVTSFDDETFQSIEGNTNDEGSREGYEVCARIRGYADKDFIPL